MVPKMEVLTYESCMDVRLMQGKPHPQNSLKRYNTSIFGTWNF